jgi:hypothetical protein
VTLAAGLAAEELTLRRFVVAERRERLASVVRTKKRYSELERCLSHGAPWDARWVTPVPVADQHADGIERILRSHGAPDDCHVLCGSGDVDGKDLPLRDALDRVVGWSIGALVICIPGRLDYQRGRGARRPQHPAPTRRTVKARWAVRGSNARPPACKLRAAPAGYFPLARRRCKSTASPLGLAPSRSLFSTSVAPIRVFMRARSSSRRRSVKCAR